MSTIVFNVLYAVLLWALVFMPSSILGGIIGSKVVSKNKKILLAGLTTQILFIVFSLSITYLLRLNSIMFFTINQESLIDSLAVSTCLLMISLVMNYMNKRNAINMDMDLIKLLGEYRALTIIVLLIVAPLGEEILFRGLLEGYLIVCNEPLYIVVVIPALLFTLVHLQPLKKQVILLGEVFVIGLLLSYLRTVFHSLIPIIISHSALNIGGILVYFFEKNRITS